MTSTKRIPQGPHSIVGPFKCSTCRGKGGYCVSDAQGEEADSEECADCLGGVTRCVICMEAEAVGKELGGEPVCRKCGIECVEDGLAWTLEQMERNERKAA